MSHQDKSTSSDTWAGKRTICEVMREIIGITDEMKHMMPLGYYRTIPMLEKAYDVSIRAQEAAQMAKRMDAKLREYKTDWDRGFWENAISIRT